MKINFSVGESRSVCLPASSIWTSSNVNFSERFVHRRILFCCLFVISHHYISHWPIQSSNMSHYFLRSSFLDIGGLSSIDLLKSGGDPVGHFYVIVIIKQTTHSCAFIQKRTLPIARDEEIFTRCCLIFIQKQNILQTLETCYIWWSCFEPIAFYWCFQWRSPIILAFSRRLPNLMTTMAFLHFQMFQTFQAYQIISGDLLSYHRPHS